MKNNFWALSLLAALPFSTATFAAEDVSGFQDKSFFGIQYGNATYEEDGFPEAEPGMILARFGKFASENLSMEARIGLGTNEGTVTTEYMGTIMDFTIEVDSLIGLYLMPGFFIHDNFRLYGALGISSASFTAGASSSSATASSSGSETGVSWGAGAEIFLSPTTSLSVEHMTYLDETAFTLSSTGVGINFLY